MAFPPSAGTVQISPSHEKATELPSGESEGEEASLMDSRVSAEWAPNTRQSPSDMTNRWNGGMGGSFPLPALKTMGKSGILGMFQ